MKNPLWSCSLNSSSPRYQDWKPIFPDELVPILAPFPIKANLGPDVHEVYMINLNALSGEQVQKLILFLAAKSGMESMDIAQTIKNEYDDKFPIRAADVVVAFSTRAF
jgi:hypothetical protein